ncbi:MAG: hypothetical protein JWP69_553 [Flaviaesturariibacter sp.]|nr:hypothetical protein [Flaviaesturariibacter sp.]
MLHLLEKMKRSVLASNEVKHDKHQDILSDYQHFVDSIVKAYKSRFEELEKDDRQELFKEYFKVFYDEAAGEAQRIDRFYIAHGRDDSKLRNDMQKICEQGLADFHALTMQCV